MLGPDSVVYSFGAGYDISFDVDLALRHPVTVHIFDPVQASIQHVGALRKAAAEGKNRWQDGADGPCYELSSRLAHALNMHPYGIWDTDTILSFYRPENPAHVSHSALPGVGPWQEKDAIQLPVKSLSSIMRALGHTHIDLLKMDVEGAEYKVIPQMLELGVYPPYMRLEAHGKDLKKDASQVRALLKPLLHAGYKIVESDLQANYTLIRG
jgi:FkbM family methyltransferase